MKANLYFGLAVAAMAITLQAAPAIADLCYRPTGRGLPRVIQCAGGFGDYVPVTLPPDRHPPAGKSTGIPVTRTPSNVLTNARPTYFRPR
jgi:hypothetical protein